MLHPLWSISCNVEYKVSVGYKFLVTHSTFRKISRYEICTFSIGWQQDSLRGKSRGQMEIFMCQLFFKARKRITKNGDTRCKNLVCLDLRTDHNNGHNTLKIVWFIGKGDNIFRCSSIFARLFTKDPFAAFGAEIVVLTPVFIDCRKFFIHFYSANWIDRHPS